VRIGTTTLESFRLWSDPEQAWMPEEDILATIRGEFRSNAKMLLGQAFGRCLEKPAKYLQGEVYRVPVRIDEQWTEYVFRASMMDRALQEFDRRGVFEVRGKKQYGPVTVVSKADQILGTAIIENKAKIGTFDFDKYAESYQWRFELDTFEGATSVTYKVFMLDEDDEGQLDLKSVESFSLYPYAGLHEDCRDLVRRFQEYVAARGLVSFLEDKQQKTEKGFVRELSA
jgi:hypothetical protein